MIENLTRREFLMYSLMTAGALSMVTAPGCGIDTRSIPDFKHDGPFLLTGGRVVDVITGRVLENTDVVCDEKGRIASVGPKPESVQGFKVIHLNGRYLVPGLIDAHCHSSVSPVFAMRSSDLFRHSKQIKMNFVNSIKSGVTTIRDMGSMPKVLEMMLRDMKYGSLPGPRVVYCNSILNIKGGHPEIKPSDVTKLAGPMSIFMGEMMNNFENIKDMRKCLVKNARGASFVKLTLDNKSLFCKKDPTLPVYTKEQMDEIFRFADSKGLPVAGHHHYKFGFDRAMQYPFHSIEHVVADERLSDKDIRTMADRKVAIVPTLTIAQSYLMEEAYEVLPRNYRTPVAQRERAVRKHYLETEANRHCNPVLHELNMSILESYSQYPCEELFQRKKFLANPALYGDMVNNGFKNLKKMKEAGVLIGCGIDAGMPLNYFGGLYREFEIFNRIGFTPLEILRCATINNAKILNRESDIGSLEVGKFADMVVFEDNPLDDVRVLRSPSLVFKQGELMYTSKDLEKTGVLAA